LSEFHVKVTESEVTSGAVRFVGATGKADDTVHTQTNEE